MSQADTSGAGANVVHPHRLDVLVIGSGFGGLCMAIKVKEAGLRVMVLERRNEVGGTWSQNTYPGCACDTQSHHYSLSFALNPDWTQRFAPQPEILAYLKDVAKKFDLYPHIRFGDAVEQAIFDEPQSEWVVTCQSGQRFRARFLVSAVGQLNEPAFPDIPGAADFSGISMHTAAWDASYDFRGKKVAVIGNGASAIQLIPELAKTVDRLAVFQRSPNWLIPKLNKVFRTSDKFLFRNLPLLMRIYRWSIYWAWERSWPEFLVASDQARKRTRTVLAGLEAEVPGAALRDDLTPDYPLGCKRILLSDDFLATMQKDNVTLITDGIDHIEGNGIVTRDGRKIDVDCLVYATGFKAHQFLPGITVLGRRGRNLKEDWAKAGGANAYLGIALPGYPNFFMTYGPNTNLGHNSIVFMLECQAHYILQLIRAARRDNRAIVEVTAAASEAFQSRLEDDLAKTAWAGSCSSWYKSAKGRIINNWSSSTIRYWLLTRRFKRADYTLS
jgi:cation diffusion facilitator CzcD-associated flavoprotein CzcO